MRAAERSAAESGWYSVYDAPDRSRRFGAFLLCINNFQIKRRNSMQYDFAAIEKKWQDNWEKSKPYAAVTGDKTRKKFYGLIEFPYPSAAGLHVGHPRPFTAIDVVTRKKRMEGYNVLFPIGFDAFGLPTETSPSRTMYIPPLSPSRISRISPGSSRCLVMASTGTAAWTPPIPTTTSGPSGYSSSYLRTTWHTRPPCP